jgi:signal transduction histidine kinase
VNISSRLTAAFSSVLFTIGAGALITNWQFGAVGSDARRIIEIDNRLTSVQQVERDLGAVSRHIAALVEQQRESRLLAETQGVRNVLAKRLIDALAAFGGTGLAQRNALAASIRSVYDELDAIDRLAQIGDWQAIRLRVNMQLDQIMRDIGDVVHEVADEVQLDREAAMRQIDLRRQRAQVILAATAVISLLASLLLGYYVTRSITQPLLALKRAAHQLARRDFDLRVRTDTNDELAEVGRDLLVAGSNLRASYSALERSNADLENFARAVSHDLREPLRTVRLYSQLLESRHAAMLGPDGSRHLSQIANAAIRMNELIEGILAYSRLTHSGGRLEELNVSEIVETVLHNLQVLISESRAEICVESLPRLSASRVQMIQVFQNLVSNALKYRRKDVTPVIHISARREPGCWIFSIKDNGIGIQSEDQQRIFAPFQQIDPSRAGGVGLGLATTKRMVEQQGGDLWLRSEGANGSEFFFSVPSRTPPSL